VATTLIKFCKKNKLAVSTLDLSLYKEFIEL